MALSHVTVESSKRMQTCFPIAWWSVDVSRITTLLHDAWLKLAKNDRSADQKLLLKDQVTVRTPVSIEEGNKNYKAVMSCNFFPDHVGDKSFLSSVHSQSSSFIYRILPHLSSASLCACNALDIIACNWTSSCSVAPAEQRLTTNHTNT